MYIANVTLCLNLRKYDARNTYGGVDARLHALFTAEYVWSTMNYFTHPPLYRAEDNICFIVAAWFSGPDVIIIIIIIYLLTAIGLSPGDSGYFTCTQNMKLVTHKFKSGWLHETHVVATWNLGNRLSIWLM